MGGRQRGPPCSPSLPWRPPCRARFHGRHSVPAGPDRGRASEEGSRSRDLPSGLEGEREGKRTQHRARPRLLPVPVLDAGMFARSGGDAVRGVTLRHHRP